MKKNRVYLQYECLAIHDDSPCTGRVIAVSSIFDFCLYLSDKGQCFNYKLRIDRLKEELKMLGPVKRKKKWKAGLPGIKG